MSEKPRQHEPEPQPEPEQLASENLESKTENELSSEVIEKIMSKVEDINTKGIAYKTVSHLCSERRAHEIFEYNLTHEDKRGIGIDIPEIVRNDGKEVPKFIDNIKQQKTKEALSMLRRDLQYGIQRGVGDAEDEQRLYILNNPKEWKKAVRGGKTRPIYFNIVGRSPTGLGKSTTEIDNSYFADRDSLTILFDISGRQELPPYCRAARRLEKNGRRNSFRADDPQLFGAWEKFQQKSPGIKLGDEALKRYLPKHGCYKFDEGGFPMPSTDYGFTLSGRVASRKFRGIVLGLRSLDYGPRREHLKEWTEAISSLIQEVYHNEVEKYLPIYDTDGNLLWPKQMSYEEIKRLVAEREAKKTKK